MRRPDDQCVGGTDAQTIESHENVMEKLRDATVCGVCFEHLNDPHMWVETTPSQTLLTTASPVATSLANPGMSITRPERRFARVR